MHSILNGLVLGFYLATLTYVAVRSRAASQFEDFSLARRALPVGMIFASLAATYVGPAFSIGFVGKGFQSGFLFLAIGLAYALQNILTGLWVAPRLRALKGCHTLGDVFEQRYGQACHWIAGLISVGLCAGFAAVMVKAGVQIVRDIVPVPAWAAVLIVVGVTTSYTSFGGLRASVATDAFQFIVFSILLPAIFLWIVVFKAHGGLAGFSREVVSATQAGLKTMNPAEFLGLVTAFLLGETLIPPYANRTLASRTTRVSRNSFLLAGAFSVVWFTIMAGMGVVARQIVPSQTNGDAVLMTLVRTTLPGAFYVALQIVLISIVMSSLDSLLNAGAVAFAQDLMRPLVRPSDRALLRGGRVATVLIGAVAAIGAMAVPEIIRGLLICYTVWAPAILPALVLGLWLVRPRPLAGILSMVCGGGAAIGLEFLVPGLNAAVLDMEPTRLGGLLRLYRDLSSGVPTWIKDAPSILVALAVAILAYAVGHWIGKEKTE